MKIQFSTRDAALRAMRQFQEANYIILSEPQEKERNKEKVWEFEYIKERNWIFSNPHK